MRKAGTVLGRILPVVPKTGEYAFGGLMVAYRTAEVTADVAHSLDFTLISIKENVMILHPAGKLAVLVEFPHAGKKMIRDVFAVFLHRNCFQFF